MAYRTITLFSAPPISRTRPSSFAVSMLAHCVILGLVYFGVARATHVRDPEITERYTFRLLELHKSEPPMRPYAPGGMSYPGPHEAAQTTERGGGGGTPSSVPRQLARLTHAAQTLVQPQLPDVQLPKETPIPAALLWNSANSKIKRIIPRPLRQANTGNVPPTFDPPNNEVNLADLKISSSPFVTPTPAPPPSTTTPVTVHSPQPVRQVPEMASSSVAAPTSVQVLSISDLQMQNGIIALPPANETAAGSPSGVIISGHGESGLQAGTGNSTGRQSGAGAGQGSGEIGRKDTSGGDGSGTGAGSTGKNGGAAGHGSGASSGGAGNGSLVNHITLRKDGRFGVVVVGSSLAEAYPETLGLWGGRLAYTVYVHAGLAKNWILQYAIPGSADAASAGDVVRPEAPWPFDILVPHLASGELYTDTIMVHGFVNVAGRFEQLDLVSPAELPDKEFVLNTLQSWQFRPATQNGQATAVEVLLIIPELPD